MLEQDSIPCILLTWLIVGLYYILVYTELEIPTIIDDNNYYDKKHLIKNTIGQYVFLDLSYKKK